MSIQSTIDIISQRFQQARQDTLYINSVYFFLNTVSISGLGFLFWWIAARFYPAENVGFVVVFVTTAQLITTVANLGFSFSLIRFLPITDQKSDLINFVLTYTSGLALLLAFIVALVGPHVSREFIPLGQKWSLTFLFICFTLLLSVFQLSQPVYSSLRAVKVLFSINLLTALGRIIFIIPFSRLNNDPGLLYAYTIPTILAAVTFVFILKREIPGYLPKIKLILVRWKQIVKYSSASYTGNVLHDLPYQVLPQITANKVGLAEAAYFYIIWNFFSMITTLANSISLSLFVEGSYDGKRLRIISKRALNSTVGITMLLSITVIILARPILSFFGPDYVENGLSLLRIVALAAVPASIVYSKVAYLRIIMRLSLVILAFFIIALFSLTLATSNIYQNLVVIGWIWLISQSLAAAFLLLTTKPNA